MPSSEKQRVAFVSLLASLGLAVSKLAAGLVTGSLGILSEAIHSIIDFGATIVTLIAIRWSDQPPDAEHHYGHAKAESVAALIATGLLFFTMAWIVWEAVKRLVTGETHVDVTWWAAAIIAASIFIDLNRSRALTRVAKKTSSEALEADALHFSSDMWSSVVVLFGLGAVWYGIPAADAIAALAVSFFVGLAGWRLGKRTLNTLLDRAPEGATEKVRHIVSHVDGILALRGLRLRPAGATLFVSIVVEVARTMPVDDMVNIKDTIHARVREAFPNADVTVAANPVALDSETVLQKTMLIAARRNLAIHHVTVQQIKGRLAVSFDLEVDGAMALVDAHETATKLENAIRRELGGDVEVESHIEPQPEHLLEGNEASAKEAAAVTKALTLLAAKQKRLSQLHNIRIRQTDQGVFVHYHCIFAGEDTIDDVHACVDHIENGLQEKFPNIRRVIAHAEPAGRARHEL
ncbi:MAG: cation diffusion facilitator family transporter [Rhizobiales bacterium]|nr:cation diffusion facilitator family transporter [Hyphomicrobiales bacterium]